MRHSGWWPTGRNAIDYLFCTLLLPANLTPFTVAGCTSTVQLPNTIADRVTLFFQDWDVSPKDYRDSGCSPSIRERLIQFLGNGVFPKHSQEDLTVVQAGRGTQPRQSLPDSGHAGSGTFEEVRDSLLDPESLFRRYRDAFESERYSEDFSDRLVNECRKYAPKWSLYESAIGILIQGTDVAGWLYLIILRIEFGVKSPVPRKGIIEKLATSLKRNPELVQPFSVWIRCLSLS